MTDALTHTVHDLPGPPCSATNVQVKNCYNCHEEKPLDAFKRDKRRMDGRGYICKTCSRAKCFEWRKANSEHVTAYLKKRIHPPRPNRLRKNRLRDNRPLTKEQQERKRAYQTAWAKKHPHVVALSWRNRRARKLAAEGKHTAGDITRLFKQQKGRCAYCAKSLRTAFHIDHVVPLALGGSNWARNLQLLCPPCNLAKRAKDPIDFAQELGKLI
jgi:5-methylcytosine-specific restriction endonuclease McrA